MKRTLAAILLLASSSAFAQGTGTIHGLVTDPAGLPVAKARVAATLGERGATRSAETDTQGGYALTALPIGTWSIAFEAPGFKQFRRDAVSLNANESVRVDGQLAVGSVSESVTVTGEATLVDSRSSTMGTLIDARRVLELPINGRNVIGLATMLPGASQVSAPQTFTDDRGGGTASMSGSRPNQNLFLFDGSNYNALFRSSGLNYPPPDALQEVKVLTNNFSAEYGRNSGAVFNVITRSGTNQIHGSLWEFLRNHNLNARNFFAGSDKPKLVQNQFGGAAGGPISRNRLFVFGSYEGLRIRPASLLTSPFPLNAAERVGDFSGYTGKLVDPLTNLPFPGQQIPASRIDTVAKNVLTRNLMPLPNRPDGQLVTTYPNPKDNATYTVRGDYNRGRHTIDARYYRGTATNTGYAGDVPSYLPQQREALTQNATVGDTWSIGPTLLSQTRIGYTRFHGSTDTTQDLTLNDLGGSFPPFTTVPPYLVITGRISMGSDSNVRQTQVNESWDLNQSLSWTRGSHTVKGGFELLKLTYLNRDFWQSPGTYNFTGQISGNPAADFVLGRPASLVVANPALEQAGSQFNSYYYIQDDWRVHPRLTLNLGMRYELAMPWVQPHDLWGSLLPGVQSKVIPTAPLGMVFAGDPGVPRGFVQTDKNNFAPRFGFAWDPRGNGRTSVRGAYGIFYETVNADIIQNTGQPFRYTYTINAPYSLSDPLRGQAPIPLTLNLKNPTFSGTQELSYPDPALRSGYVQQFNLNVQREVVRNFMVQAGYVGKLGRKMIMGWASNPAIYAPGATLANINQRRILPGYGNNREISSLSNSSYHALQMDVNKRFSRGFSVQGVYTFSRSIDMRSGIAAVGANTPNVFDFHSEWGLSDFHAKHIASFSWIWDIPGPRRRVLRAVAGGWQVNGLVHLRSGLPFNVVSGVDNALSGTSNQRPNVIGQPLLSGDRVRAEKILAWFDRTAFVNPATGTFGNVGRNALIGPSSANTNFAAFRNIALPGREGLRLQFRAEFFNVFNSVNLSNPNASLNAGTRMGRITGAGEARVIQFALKLLF